MLSWNAIVSLATFVSVMILMITERLHLTIAALIGALLLVLLAGDCGYYSADLWGTS